MIRLFLDPKTWRRFAACGQILAIVLLPVQSLHPQTLGEAQNLTELCAGPLGALLPECQAVKTSIDLPSSTVKGAPAVAPAAAQVSAGQPAAPETPPPPSPAPAPPEPPSEFQRFIASSIGQVLPIFGASLFEAVPTTFAPIDRVPVTAEYVIGPGDEILLRVWGQINLDLALPVDRTGSIYIPQVGNVSVSGLQFKQLPDYLRSQLERVFRNFDLSVNMGKLRSIQIYVVGQARRPGTYTVSSLSTLVNALFASGGPSSKGSMRRIQLKRGVQVVVDLDLYDLVLRGDKSADVRLLPEDVIYIPTVGPQVAIAGSVKNPAIYELKNEKTVGDLIQMAGGLTAVADPQRVTLERIKDSASRQVLELSLREKGMEFQIADGDLLQVLAILPRFENTVTLRGNVADPGRFPWRPGMRLRDIIPDKESLITRDYWKKRNILGYTPLETAIAADPASEAARKPAGTRIEPAVPDINWSYAVIERQRDRDLATELIPFHLGKLVLENDERQNLELRAGDVVTIFSQADIRVPQMQQTRLVRMEGEFNAPGVYNVGPGETLGDLIQRAGGLTPQAYLYASEFMREAVRRDQQRRLDDYVRDLEREIEQTATIRLSGTRDAEDAAAMAAQIQAQQRLAQRLRSVQATGRIILGLDPGSNDTSKIAGLPLEDGDRFVVPPKPATVNVLGAVYNPNSFLHAEKGRVADYIRYAGGPTRNADKKRMYIVRADGSVLPRQDPRFGSFKADFSKLQLNPGDSIVVPDQILKGTLLAGLRDWSQVIFQFGLGAAAINVLR